MEPNASFFAELKKIFKNTFLFIAFISIFAYSFKGKEYSRTIIYGSCIAFLIVQIVNHYIIYRSIRWWRETKILPKTILIAGSGPCAIDIMNEFNKNNLPNIKLFGMLSDEEISTGIEQKLIVGKTSDAESIFRANNIDEVYIALPSSADDRIKTLIETANYFGIRVRMIPEFYRLFGRQFEVEQISGIPIINVNEIPLDNYYNSCYKRIFDIAFSSIALIVLFPFLLIISVAIKLSSKGPVFYVPERVGIGCRVFKLYKFRTMYHTQKNADKESTKPRDSRITPIGKVLRKASIDEFPQFFNVLKGDMSIVGPRPHRVYLNRVFQDCVNNYMTRHYIKPGITGWAQVNGWRGPTTTDRQKTARTDHDLWYLNNWSLILDVKIILLTVFGTKVRKNAF
jgi:putative colanic acid biosynthesis UDP-glucose lipid carrier transferase